MAALPGHNQVDMPAAVCYLALKVGRRVVGFLEWRSIQSASEVEVPR